MTATIIYYSSGREKPDFEERVKENILKVSGGLPIIAVTQKELYPKWEDGYGSYSNTPDGFIWRNGPFGFNICVRDVGASGFNMFRQVQIGCRAATTDLIISAEADCLYPPDYFTFRPPRLDIAYRDTNLYVMPDARDYFFYKKEGATHAQIVGREFYLKTLDRLFEGAPMWSTEEKNFPKERHQQEDVFTKDQLNYWRSDNPVFQIKTHRGMRYFTHSDRTPVNELPYWGLGKVARAKYLHGRDS